MGPLIMTISPPLPPGTTVLLTRRQVPEATSALFQQTLQRLAQMQKKTMQQGRSMHHYAVRDLLCQQQEASSLPSLVRATRPPTASSPAAAT
jgi:hypothetical protein